MRHETAGVALLAAVTLLFLAPASAFADAEVTLEGSLSVNKDAEGKVQAANLTVCEGDRDSVYGIKMDEKGLKVATEMGGKEIVVHGTVSDGDAGKTLAVSDFMVVVVGTVAVEKDGEGNSTSVRIRGLDDSGDTAVKMDDQGKKLAGAHAGALVQAAGAWVPGEGSGAIAVKKFAALAKVKGFVEVEEDDEGNAKGAKLTVDEGETSAVYPLMLDRKGRSLMNDMAWETVEASGMFYTRNGKKWFRVYSFAKAESEEPPDEGEGDDEGDEEDEGAEDER